MTDDDCDISGTDLTPDVSGSTITGQGDAPMSDVDDSGTPSGAEEEIESDAERERAEPSPGYVDVLPYNMLLTRPFPDAPDAARRTSVAPPTAVAADLR